MPKVEAILVTPRFSNGYGGVQRYLMRLASELAPSLAVMAPGPPVKNWPFKYKQIKQNFALPNKALLKEITAYLGELNCKNVIFGTPWPYVLLGPALNKRGYKYSVIVHGTETLVPLATLGFNRLWQKSLLAADTLFAVSESTKAELLKLLKNKTNLPKIKLLKTSVDTNFYKPARQKEQLKLRASLGIENNAPVALYLGRLSARKGVNKLIDAWNVVDRKVPGAVLVIAGSGNHLPRLKLQAKTVAGNIIFTGKVTDEEAVVLYTLADVFILPAGNGWGGKDVEGLGIVLLEAQSCGTPVIVGNSGGTKEALVNGKTGILLNSLSQKNLAEATVKMLLHKQESKQMGKAGRKFVLADFAGSAELALLTD